MHIFLKKYTRILCGFILIAFISSCATYYQKNEALMKAVYDGKYDVADKLLSDPKLEKKKKDILLYYFNRGTVNWMMNRPQESNKYFQLADFYIEDYQKSYASKALSFISNPKVEPYAGEGFEQILLHYYTTLNYISIGGYDEALVECKRMQMKLQKITDTYKGKNKYKKDAFVHTLMGIIYDAQGDYNNAFIAYRNALEIYSDDYSKQLNTGAPVQLKKDLIRTAYLTGFTAEAKDYEEKFSMRYAPEDKNNGSLVFFWNNGLGPVKDEWSITFAVVPAGNGWMNFVNTELGLVFPYYTGDDQSNSLSGLKVVRVAFPKYVTRNPLFTSATLKSDSLKTEGKLEMLEPVNEIAYKSLEDRMLKELGEALLRLAIKQLAESQVRKQNEGLGVAMSLLNAATEQADTRNWQLLPYAIEYTRMSLPAGIHNLTLVTEGNKKQEQPVNVRIGKGKTTVSSLQSPEFTGFSNK